MGRRRKKGNNVGAVIGIVLCSLVVIGVGLGVVMGSAEEMEKNFCLGEGQPGTAVFTDYSLRLGTMQRKSAMEYFRLLYNRMDGNERFTIYASKRDKFGSVLKKEMELCRPVRSKEEATDNGGRELAKAYLAKMGRKAFDGTYWPGVEKMLSLDISEAETMKDSPLLEFTQSLSRVPDLTGKPFNKIVMISDMIMNSDGVSFCYKQGHLPSYEKFTTTSHWERLQPDPFTGVEVEILWVVQYLEGLFCTQKELEAFWTEFFMKNGARSVKIIHLREGI